MRSLIVPSRRPTARRATEATPAQILATGAAGWGYDPGDNEKGWAPVGSVGRRNIPQWTVERARVSGIASYRSNPMAKAILDTYTSFCVGDKGVTYQVTNPRVRDIVDQFWNDSRNQIGQRQELGLRSLMLNGERLLQTFTGPQSGVVRYAPVDPSLVTDVTHINHQAMWPDRVWFGPRTDDPTANSLPVVAVNDRTGLREGQALWWTPWLTTDTDTRSMPFLMPILDDLDNYYTVISNMIDRTAILRYFVWDVTVDGGQPEVEKFIKDRGGKGAPDAGSVEVHNSGVKWEAKSASSNSAEDSVTASQVLTQIAGGAGLARTWLADPEDSNRATSISMAEPVRRRVAGVQKMWLDLQTEFVRYAIDQAVAAKRLPASVEATDPKTGETFSTPTAMCAVVTGPQVAAADASITATTLMNLATALTGLVATGALSQEAARVAAKKGWEDFTGIPYVASLDSPEANPDDLATHIDDIATKAARGGPPRTVIPLHQPAG